LRNRPRLCRKGYRSHDTANPLRVFISGQKRGLPPDKAGIKALLEKIVAIMREAPHLRMLFNPMSCAFNIGHPGEVL
jgi:hypothetical protein